MVPQDSPPSPEDHTAIYFLFGSNGRVRYIGKSIAPGRRWKQHLREQRGYGHVNKWLMRERSRGYAPTMLVIEWCGDNWPERERFWIGRGRALGWPITNILDGGGTDGVRRYPKRRAMTSEHRRKIGEAQRRSWAARHAERSRKQIGHIVTPESRKKMSVAQHRRFERMRVSGDIERWKGAGSLAGSLGFCHERKRVRAALQTALGRTVGLMTYGTAKRYLRLSKFMRCRGTASGDHQR